LELKGRDEGDPFSFGKSSLGRVYGLASLGLSSVSSSDAKGITLVSPLQRKVHGSPPVKLSVTVFKGKLDSRNHGKLVDNFIHESDVTRMSVH